MKNIWNSGISGDIGLFYVMEQFWELHPLPLLCPRQSIKLTLSALGLSSRCSPGPPWPKPEKKRANVRRKRHSGFCSLVFLMLSPILCLLQELLFHLLICLFIQCLLGAYHVPGILWVLLSWHLICHTNLWGGPCYPWSINECTEAQGSWMISPRTPAPRHWGQPVHPGLSGPFTAHTVFPAPES